MLSASVFYVVYRTKPKLTSLSLFSALFFAPIFAVSSSSSIHVCMRKYNFSFLIFFYSILKRLESPRPCYVVFFHFFLSLLRSLVASLIRQCPLTHARKARQYFCECMSFVKIFVLLRW